MGETRKLAGRYRLLNPLGSGSVRLAFDEVEHRDVAVRELRVPAELRGAALQDAQRAAGLRHASVVPVLDVVVEDGEPWLIMEFVSGTSLEKTVDSRHPLPVQQAARVGVCLLSALRTAHETGIIHGRVNPGNVLLTSTGRAVLTGFGLPGLGMRPSADMWSMAATLHFAVEGRPPGRAPAESTDAFRWLVRAMLDPAGPPPVEMVAEMLDRLAVAQTLGHVLAAGGSLPPARVAEIGLAVLDQLAELHSRGAHHGGVQPGNVLIDADGRATLATTPLPAPMSLAPVMPATIAAYTAPERVPGPAADLWSLGATLFAAVEGHPPVPGAPLAKAGALAPVLFRLLSGFPAHRPGPDALRKDLQAVADLF
ncbi:protein kinase [Nonomuraea sp. NEAU-A123]|uniref:protein kinase domain-containing protein n=1 Tax=Nonomuraea sp. NEAU-A123 TaxID=2839649 RepID=UPI001BE3DAA8|nr:protein kinase [Nonomuraea sp. NEAU-A123]MBT2224835.1 protein kinase [Nonomuraea sp. NEAU-A123]